MDEESEITSTAAPALAPVHHLVADRGCYSSVAPSTTNTETGEAEEICVVSLVTESSQQHGGGCQEEDEVVVNNNNNVLSGTTGKTSEMDLDAAQLLEQQQCATCTDTLLPKTTEEACTQTLPDHCPPYVDIRSPAVAPSSMVVGLIDRGAVALTGEQCIGGSTTQLSSSLVSGLCNNNNNSTSTPTAYSVVAQDGSPCITPGQCTPLLEHKHTFSSSTNTLNHHSLHPAVIYGGSASSGAAGGGGTSAAAEKSDTSSAILPICRICHMPGELDDEQEMLISPCRCAGTLQFIHNTCLQKWLEISAKKSRKPPKCELCHYQYHRHKKFKFSHWRFPRVSRQDKILHVVFVFNLVIMIACAVATVMCFLSDKGQITKFPRNKVDLTTEEIITLSCGVLFFVSFFIAMSVQIKAKHTIYQLFVKFVMQNMEWEIDEYDKSKDTMFTKAPSGKSSKHHPAAFV